MKNILYFSMMAGFLFAGSSVYAQANMAGTGGDQLEQQDPAEIQNSSSGGGVSTPYQGEVQGSTSANDHRQQGGGHVTVQDILGVDNSTPAQKPGVLSTGNGTDLDGSTDEEDNSTGPQQAVVPGGGSSGSGVGITIYPNPTVDGVNVVTEGEIIFGVVELFDLTGKAVKKQNTPSGGSGNSSNIYVSLSGLKAGMYLIRFQTDKNTYVKRIQVK